MNELQQIVKNGTMSSMEISELTEKLHYNVLADIRKMLEELEISCPEISGQLKDESGKMIPIHNLSRELTFTLVSGYNIKMRNAIINRWLELEDEKILSANRKLEFSEENLCLVKMNLKRVIHDSVSLNEKLTKHKDKVKTANLKIKSLEQKIRLAKEVVKKLSSTLNSLKPGN